MGGPLHVSNARSLNPLSEVFVEAAEQAGFKRNTDFNGECQDGFGITSSRSGRAGGTTRRRHFYVRRCRVLT